MFKDVAHEYVHMCSSPAQARHLIDRAVRIAKIERTVTYVIFPNDVQEMDAVEKPPRAHGIIHSGIGYTLPQVIPHQQDLQRVAEVLNIILVGAGALGATDEVIKVADLLGAGVAKALLGKAALPDDLPFVTGAIGLLGTKPSWELMDMSKYLRRILEIDPEHRRAVVEPGCVLDDLRDNAEKHHLTFGPDPATHDHNTLGGMIGNNSCGIHSIMARRTADNINAL